MLKLKKKSQKGPVHVIIDHKNGITPFLLYALGIALALHITAAFMFHVELFKFIDMPPLQTIEVSGDLGMAEGTVTADEKSRLRMISKAPEPQPSMIAPPPPPFSILDLPLDSFSDAYSMSLPLLRLDGQLDHINLDGGLPSAALSVALTGGLSSREIVQQPPLPILAEVKTPLKAVVQVQMQEKTGKIFWINWLTRTGIAAVDKALEKWILDLQIASMPEAFTLSGEIEIALNNRGVL